VHAAGEVEVVDSAAFAGTGPDVSVVVSTFRRPGFLDDIVAALEAQELERDRFEVVVVDNGSGDETWDRLVAIAAATPLRLRAVRVVENHGPARGRNTGVAHSRAPLLAITDDDCLPQPGWLAGLLGAFDDPGVAIAQGRVEADPRHRERSGPWDHTIWVTGPSPFFETCNIAYRRDAFDAAGGFDETDPLLHPPSGRAFGEDACLAWEVHRAGGRAAFVDGAVVHHRCLPGTYAQYLSGKRQLERFPGLARRTPLLADALTAGVFLNRRSALFDAAAAGIAAALVTRRPWPALASLPWAVSVARRSHAMAHGRPAAAVRLSPRLAWGDVVTFSALARGSVRHRRLVL
jgi:hypothetical protein